jgi:hypothetical protein
MPTESGNRHYDDEKNRFFGVSLSPTMVMVVATAFMLHLQLTNAQFILRCS